MSQSNQKPSGPRLIKAAVKQRASNEDDRVPPHDLDAERTVLAMLMFAEGTIDKARNAALCPGDFYVGAHGTLFETVLEVGVSDAVLVCSRLRERGVLAEVGGVSAVTEMLGLNGGAPTVSLDRFGDYMSVVRRRARERDLLYISHRTVAELYTKDVTGRETWSIVSELKTQLESIERGIEHGTAITFLSADDLVNPEPELDLIVPMLGLGAGPPIGFFGQGYSGKTMAAMSMGMSVATGKDVWGHFRCRRGRWVHLDYEQGRRRSKTMVQRMAAAMGVDLRTLVAEGLLGLAVYPSVDLTTSGAVEHFVRAFNGATLVTCDALKPMTPGVDENSSVIRDHMKILHQASERTGAACVLVHHAGKTPMNGERPRKEAGRGSSGIYDDCQSVFVMSSTKGEPTWVTHEKDRNLGYTVDGFGLKIEDVPTDDGNLRGGLRVVHLDREQLAPKKNAASDEWKATLERVKKCIDDDPGIAGIDAVRAKMKMNRVTVAAAVQTLLNDGAVVERLGSGKGRARRLYTAHKAPPNVTILPGGRAGELERGPHGEPPMPVDDDETPF